MAATCPNCGKKLHFYDIKAECTSCGVSIPNYNWEARLEEDSEKAEKNFTGFYRNLNRIAYSIWGTKLRIARIIMSFIPAIGFILPWASLKSDAKSINFDVIGIFTQGESLISFVQSFFGNTGLYFTNMAYEGHSGPVTYTMISLVLMVLSLLFAVIAFFLIIFTFKHSKTKAMVVFDGLSIASAVASAVVFKIGASSTSTFASFNFGDFPMVNAHGGVQWGFFVALALLVVAFVFNLLVAKAPAKSDDELESERLARKAEKDAKEHENELRKQKEREEADKKAAEEQAALVEKAKASLAAAEQKKNKK